MAGDSKSGSWCPKCGTAMTRGMAYAVSTIGPTVNLQFDYCESCGYAEAVRLTVTDHCDGKQM